jgi:hypothetical protein
LGASGPVVGVALGLIGEDILLWVDLTG